MSQIIKVATTTLKSNPRNARTHSKKQIKQIAKSITAFGFLVPILIDDFRDRNGNTLQTAHWLAGEAVLIGPVSKAIPC